MTRQTVSGTSMLRHPWLGYALAPVLAAGATVVAALVEQWTPVRDLSLIFVLPVIVLAVTFGWRSAMAAAVLSVLSFNFFLIEPRYTLRVNDPANVWALVLLFLVASMVSALAAQSRRRAQVATTLADQAMALQSLAQALVAAPDAKAILAATAEALNRVFHTGAAVVVPDGAAVAYAVNPLSKLTDGDVEAARWAIGSRTRTRAAAFPTDAVTFDFWPVAPASPAPAAIGLDLAAGTENLPADWPRLLDIVSGYLSVALEREHFADRALKARVHTESERVKADLLAAVSHDLKTPLSAILVSLQSLRRFAGGHDRQTRDDLLAVAEAETERLSGLVSNLLDMSRIDADAIAVRPTRVNVRALFDAARLRAGAALAGHAVSEHLADEALSVQADVSLTETALANVLENAAKYSPAGSPIQLHAELGGLAGETGVVISVLDSGPGFPDPAEPLFGKFTRGVDGDGRPPGTGLGLAIARGFIEAQGGRIEAAARPDAPGGAVRILLPLSRARSASRSAGKTKAPAATGRRARRPAS